jgi:hypothetical protein
MATAKCPALGCTSTIAGLPYDYADTVQCSSCGAIAYVVISNGSARYVHLRKFDLDVPPGLPEDLNSILTQAIACYDAGSPAATVVMSGLFLEGLLARIGITADRLVDMINQAHTERIISTLGFHVASASRLLRNVGAHYSPELVALGESDARLVLEMVRKLALDILHSGKLPSDSSDQV